MPFPLLVALFLVGNGSKPGTGPLRGIRRVAVDLEVVRSFEKSMGIDAAKEVVDRLRAGGVNLVPKESPLRVPLLSVTGYNVEDKVYWVGIKLMAFDIGGKPKTLRGFWIPWDWGRQARSRREAQAFLTQGLDAFVRDWKKGHPQAKKHR